MMLPSVNLDDFLSTLSAIQTNRLPNETTLSILQGIKDNTLSWTLEEQGCAFFWILRNAMGKENRRENLDVLESAFTVLKEIREQEVDSVLKKTVEGFLRSFESGLYELVSEPEEGLTSYLYFNAVLLRYGPPQRIDAQTVDSFLAAGEPDSIELVLECLALEERLSKIVCPILDEDLDQEKMGMLQQGIKKVGIDKLSEEDLAALFVKLAEKQERQADFLNECLRLYFFNETPRDSCRLLVEIVKQYNSHSCFLLILNLLTNFNVKLYSPPPERGLRTFIWSIGQTLFGRCLEGVRADFETPLIAAFAKPRPPLLLIILLLHKKRQLMWEVEPEIENQELKECLDQIFQPPSTYVVRAAAYNEAHWEEVLMDKGNRSKQQLLLLISYYGEERIISLLSEEQRLDYADLRTPVPGWPDFSKVFDENFFGLEQDEKEQYKAQFDAVFEGAHWENFVDLLAQIKRDRARLAPGA